MLREGGLRGAKRLARHLWRMRFGLFIASGSFFFGQAKFLRAAIRIGPPLGVLGVAALVILWYWMWHVRLRHRLTGIVIRSADAAQATPHRDIVARDPVTSYKACFSRSDFRQVRWQCID
jgi:hypothetical protein